LRDDDGVFVSAKTMSFSSMCSVAVGEALDLLYALQWIQDMQFDNVDFVVYSKTTANAFHSRLRDITEFGLSSQFEAISTQLILQTLGCGV